MTIELAGDREIQRALSRMNREVHKKVLRASIRSAMAPARKASKAMIPVDSGALRDSMKISIKALPPFVMVGKLWPDKKLVVGFLPTDNISSGQKRRPIKYAHLVEGGHDVVRGGRVIGHVPPQPFIRDAFEQTKFEQVRRFKKSFLRGAQREWRKLTGGHKPKRRLA